MISKEQVVYPNGIKHINYYVPFLKSVSLNFLVNAGSASELRSEQWGAAHFLEHMLFNGDEKYPDPKETRGLVQQMGGYENAWTSDDYTTYRIVVLPDQFDQAFDLLFHRVYKPLLRESDVDKERGIIQEERVMYENMPTRNISHALSTKIFEGSPYAHDTIGTKESLEGMSSHILREYHQKYYSPHNSVFVTYGGMKMEQISDTVAEMLSSLEQYDVNHMPITFEPFETQPDTVKISMDAESTYYSIATINTRPDGINDLVDLILFWNSLSSGVGSIFNQELRVKDSLAAGFRDYSYFSRAFTTFKYLFEVDISKVEKLQERVNDVLGRYEELFTDEQFERVSGISYGNFLTNLEEVDHPSTLAYENMTIANLTYGTDFTYEQFEKALRSRTREDVINISKRLLPGVRKVEGILTPKN